MEMEAALQLAELWKYNIDVLRKKKTIKKQEQEECATMMISEDEEKEIPIS